MRWIIIGGVLALVVTIYALVDLTVTDDRRIRRLNRVLWVVLIVVLPLIGPAAWLTWGKGPRSQARPFAPDDDPSFSRSPDVSDDEADRRIAELEAQLAALDDEDFSGATGTAGATDTAASPPAPEQPGRKAKPAPKPAADAEDDGDAGVDGSGRRSTGDGGDSARA